MVGCSHRGIPFVGASGEKSWPGVELENIKEIQTNLDSVMRWLQSTVFFRKSGISIHFEKRDGVSIYEAAAYPCRLKW